MENENVLSMDNEPKESSQPLPNSISNTLNKTKPLDEQDTHQIIDKPLITKNDQRVSTNYDFLFKVSLIGDSGTGKTSVLLRLTENTFKENTSSTIGVDFKILSVKYKSKLAKIQIWDTCGSERFKSLTTSFIKTCAVFVLIFDLSNKKSFEDLAYWVNLILDNTSPKVMCLVGNKSDLIVDKSNPVIEEDAINSFCEKYGMRYLQTSAKDNINIEEMFQHITISLFREAEKSLQKRESDRLDNKCKTIDVNNNSSSRDSLDGESEKNKKFSLKGIFKKPKDKITGCCSKGK